METRKLDKWELEDLEDSLFQFEKKYGIRFTQEELNSIESIEDLTNAIINKFDDENINDCTSQQAFYKLKEILMRLDIGGFEINPKTKLEQLIPRKNRIQNVKKIEKELGFKLEILQPKSIIIYTLLLLSVCVIITAFFNFFYAIIFGIVLFYLFKITVKTGKEFEIKTVGELAKEITRENYFNVRRTPKTINKKEFKKVVLDWFSDRMDIEKEELKSARFV